MTAPNLRSTQAALDVARPLIVRLDERRHPEDAAADLIEGWAAVETALRAMVGGSSLGGQALVSEVRAQGRLDYPHAHALLGFLAARDRATRPDYQPTAEDVAAARAGFQAIEAANGSGIAANTGVHQAIPRDGVLPPPPPVPPVVPRPPRDAPPRPSGNGASPAPYGPPHGRDAGPPPPPLPPQGDEWRSAPRRGLSPLLLAGLALLLVALGAGGYFALRRGRPTPALAEGRAAYGEGRREAARAAFERALAEQPQLAEPRVYLARLAREDGDIPRATAYLDSAIRLDQTSAVAFREMGQLQLYANRPDLAVSFFRRAIERDESDRVALGWMACSLTRAGNAELAERFYQRAGTGEWTACRQAAPTLGAPGGVPGAGAAPGSYPAAVPAARQPLTP
jgi:tetratricopeptide (TPR) repeat protein